MSFAIQPLPEDLDALRSFAADLQAELARKDIEITVRDAEIHAKTLHIEKLKMQLAVLRLSCPRFLWTRYCREKREQGNGFDQGSECEGGG